MARLLKLSAVVERTAKKKSSIYDGVARGTFPAPVAPGTWVEDEIDAYIEGLRKKRDSRLERRAS